MRRGRALCAAALLALVPLLAPAQPATQDLEGRRGDAARLMNQLMLGKGIGGDFALRDARGGLKRLSDFRGKLVLLYFGFTTCPDVCPTDLLAIAQAINALGEKAVGVQPVFVTLDPRRDTRAIIGEYVRNFHPSFVALTGTEAQIRDVARAYKVYFEKVPLPGKLGYTIDHAAFTYLLDREGRYLGFLPPGTPVERIANLLRQEL